MKKLFALSTCALALAACSNNGGTYYGPKPQMQGQNTQQGQGNSTQTPPAAAENHGDKYVATGKGTLAFTDDAKIHKLTVDGKEFDLTNANFGANFNDGWRAYGSGTVVIGSPPPAGLDEATIWLGSTDATAGLVKPTGSETRFGFFNGKFTDEKTLPTSGKVMYDTDVVVSAPGQSGFSKRELTADFETKKLTGKYSDEVMLDATIKGNRFESEKDAATTVKGGFFGDNAAEVAGTFHNGNLLGAFGGKQKPQAAPAQPQ